MTDYGCPDPDCNGEIGFEAPFGTLKCLECERPVVHDGSGDWELGDTE